jgi:hypothetical protein
MVKVQIGNSTFICDTAEEAVRIHKLASSGGSGPVSHASPANHRPATNGRAQAVMRKLTPKLTPFVGKEVSSEEMAKLIGAKGPSGLGPKMHQLRRTLANESILIDDFIVKKEKQEPREPTAWKILKAAA